MKVVASYNNNRGKALDNDAIMKLAPSVFTTVKHESRAERYSVIPTIDVVEAMRKEGFYPVAAAESRARDEAKKGFTKHMLRFRAHDGFTQVGELLPELVLINSHDGTSSYQLSSGLYRLACSNGLIVSDCEIESVRVRHSGNVVDNVIEGSYKIINETPEVMGKVESMQSLRLSTPEQIIFAKAAKELRWDEGFIVEPETLLRPRRREDVKSDVWTTFNIVQEKIIKGGVTATNKETKHAQRSREVKSVSETARLNKALWTLAEEMRKLKA